MLGMAVFKAPVLKLAKLNTRTNQPKTFLYTFDYKGEHTRYVRNTIGLHIEIRDLQ